MEPFKFQYSVKFPVNRPQGRHDASPIVNFTFVGPGMQGYRIGRRKL